MGCVLRYGLVTLVWGMTPFELGNFVHILESDNDWVGTRELLLLFTFHWNQGRPLFVPWANNPYSILSNCESLKTCSMK